MGEQVGWVLSTWYPTHLDIVVLHHLLGPQLLDRQVFHLSSSMS